MVYSPGSSARRRIASRRSVVDRRPHASPPQPWGGVNGRSVPMVQHGRPTSCRSLVPRRAVLVGAAIASAALASSAPPRTRSRSGSRRRLPPPTSAPSRWSRCSAPRSRISRPSKALERHALQAGHRARAISRGNLEMSITSPQDWRHHPGVLHLHRGLPAEGRRHQKNVFKASLHGAIKKKVEDSSASSC